MEHKQIQTHYSTHKYLKSIRLQCAKNPQILSRGQKKPEGNPQSETKTLVTWTLVGPIRTHME
jgi:hypothetical protein